MSLPLPIPSKMPDQDDKSAYLVQKLVAYKREAQANRKTGLNPRDEKWEQNIDLYWNRYDTSDKADWQSKNVMPEVPSFVDRFSASLKEALVSTPNGFYTVTDPYDTNADLMPSIKNMNDVWLSTAGRNQIGQLLDFSTVFEEQVKLGTMTNMSGVVLWKDDVKGGRVAFESVDPRQVWLDHTYRNLYRIRQTEVDLVDVVRMAGDRSSGGKYIYDLDEISRLMGSRHDDMRLDNRELTGSDNEVTSERKPIVLDEYVASVIGPDGKLLMDNEVAVVADDTYLIRGPEKNPFWHGKDWLVYTPMMIVPFSPYGRSYMEDFGSVAKIFTDLTNLLLDAVYVSTMKAFAVVPGMLTNPAQLNGGIHPNKIFELEEGYSVEDFMKAIDLGTLDAGGIQIWQAIKSELSDASGMNEIGLGQLPDKTHIAANAVAGAQQSSSAMLRSIAQTIETRFLDPYLDLSWKTGLQHAKPNDKRMMTAVGDKMYNAIISRRKEIITRPITFQARGISGLIQKQQKLQALLGVLQIIAQDPTKALMQAFMQQIDIQKFIRLLFNLTNVDLSKLEPSDRDMQIQQITGQVIQPMMAAAAGGQPSPPGMQQMGQVASALGVAQGQGPQGQ